MSGLSFGLVNNATAPHTGKRRKTKLSQKAGRISVPYLPAKRREEKTSCRLPFTREGTVKLNQEWAPPVTIPAMNTLMLAQREPAQNKPRVRYAFLRREQQRSVCNLSPQVNLVEFRGFSGFLSWWKAEVV